MSTDVNASTPTPPTTFHKPHDEGVGYDEKLESMKVEYEGGPISARKLAAKYDFPRNKLNDLIKIDKWTKFVPPASRAKKGVTHSASHIPILGPIAIRKIKEVKEELGEHYSPVDEPLIVVFSKTYERYIELEQTLMTENVVKESAKGGSYLNPTFTALQAVQKTLLTYANQLGLSMTSRKLLGIKLDPRKKSEMTLFDIANNINNMDVPI